MALRQGRYKAILLDGDALGPVCHYIHLNPVRARLVGWLVEATELEQYKTAVLQTCGIRVDVQHMKCLSLL